MKFIVDELSFFESDCPFCDDGVSCKLDGSFCEHMNMSTKERGSGMNVYG